MIVLSMFVVSLIAQQPTPQMITRTLLLILSPPTGQKSADRTPSKWFHGETDGGGFVRAQAWSDQSTRAKTCMLRQRRKQFQCCAARAHTPLLPFPTSTRSGWSTRAHAWRVTEIELAEGVRLVPCIELAGAGRPPTLLVDGTRSAGGGNESFRRWAWRFLGSFPGRKRPEAGASVLARAWSRPRRAWLRDMYIWWIGYVFL